MCDLHIHKHLWAILVQYWGWSLGCFCDQCVYPLELFVFGLGHWQSVRLGNNCPFLRDLSSICCPTWYPVTLIQEKNWCGGRAPRSQWSLGCSGRCRKLRRTWSRWAAASGAWRVSHSLAEAPSDAWKQKGAVKQEDRWAWDEHMLLLTWNAQIWRFSAWGRWTSPPPCSRRRRPLCQASQQIPTQQINRM